jgi:hypothetical protein
VLWLAGMSLQRKSLLAFLNLAKSSLSTAIQRSTPITLVVGNESAGESLARSVLAVSSLGNPNDQYELFLVKSSFELTTFKILTPSAAPSSLPTCVLILVQIQSTFLCRTYHRPTSPCGLSYVQSYHVRISQWATSSRSLTCRLLPNEPLN